MDPYAVLGISGDATGEQIKKAYWKKAKKCHPDKNPDNLEEATEKFKELTKAFDLLTDGVTRTKLDQTRKAKEAARKRREELDQETRKLRDELDEREKRVKLAKSEKEDELKRQSEIKRMKEEGKRLLEEEQERCRKQQFEARQRMETNVASHPSKSHSISQGFRLKLRWSSSKADQNNGGYSENLLRRIFSMYGEVREVLVSSLKKGSGMIEFQTKSAAMKALEMEKGLENNPLKITFVANSQSDTTDGSSHNGLVNERASSGVSASSQSSGLRTDRDFESLVMMRLRQAEERRRLIEQITQDAEDS